MQDLDINEIEKICDQRHPYFRKMGICVLKKKKYHEIKEFV